MVHKERVLLDQKKKLEDQVEWCEQTYSLLILSPTSNNLPALAAANAIQQRKQEIAVVVSQLVNVYWNINNVCVTGQGTYSLGKKEPFKKKDGPFVQALDVALSST